MYAKQLLFKPKSIVSDEEKKEIETEEENIYAMLFGLKECPYHMYTFFIMKNDDDKPMINSSLK